MNDDPAIYTAPPLEEQVKELGEFIFRHIAGEPSRSEGAVECVMRLLKDHPGYREERFEW